MFVFAKKVEHQMEERDRELIDLQAKVDRYERGEYGLRDAVAEIKEWKKEVASRDRCVQV